MKKLICLAVCGQLLCALVLAAGESQSGGAPATPQTVVPQAPVQPPTFDRSINTAAPIGRKLQRQWRLIGEDETIRVDVEWFRGYANGGHLNDRYTLKMTFYQQDGTVGSLTLRNGWGTFGKHMTFILPGAGFDTTGKFWWWDRDGTFNCPAPLIITIGLDTSGTPNNLYMVLLEDGWMTDVWVYPIELDGSFFPSN
jgi:hypothetical protein